MFAGFLLCNEILLHEMVSVKMIQIQLQIRLILVSLDKKTAE